MIHEKRLVLSLVTNLALLPTVLAVILSGFVIQIKYHMGHHGSIDKNSLFSGMNYLDWLNIHRTSIVIVSILAIIHIVLHWRWYKTIIQKRLFAKNRLVIVLTVVFIAVAITGYIPWFTALAGGSNATRKVFIEVHDKLTFVLFACFIIHIIKRSRWFITSCVKLAKSPIKETSEGSKP